MKALVTGGGGFLGSAIVRQLLARGWQVHSFHRGDYPHLAQLGITCHQAPRIDFDSQHIWIPQLAEAMRGCDVVFHTAAKAGVWGRATDYESANEIYTQGVIRACRWAGVRRLVHTSSPSVVYAGRDEENLNESAPYPDTFLADYPRTKADAERKVLAANDAELATVALRPHLIWGPGDPHLVPRIIDRARRGKLRLVGDGGNLVDSTYIDNAAHAHLLAADKLLGAPSRKGGASPRASGAGLAPPCRDGASCAGKAYFISNGEPLAMADLINRILAAAGLAPVTRSISPGAAYKVGAVLETLYRLLRIQREPVMTRFVAKQLSTAHWYDLSAARRDLGYEPIVSIDDGMRRLADDLRTRPGT